MSAEGVTIEDPDRMNLLGLMLGGMVERNLEAAPIPAGLRKLDATVSVTAGKMRVFIQLQRGHVTISKEF